MQIRQIFLQRALAQIDYSVIEAYRRRQLPNLSHQHYRLNTANHRAHALIGKQL